MTQAQAERDRCWSHLLVHHVDDALHIDHNPDKLVHKLCKEHSLKNDKFAKPEWCLGANVKRCKLQNSLHWSMSACNCLREACEVIKGLSAEDRQRWIAKRNDTMVKAHRPEINTSALLEEELLEFCVGESNWGGWTSQQKSSCCQPTVACRVRVIWKRHTKFLSVSKIT